MSQQTPPPRTTQDDYNRLIAVAFEKQVNAEAYAGQLEQKLAMAGQIIEQLRSEVKEKDEKIAQLSAQTVADEGATAD